MSCIGVLIEHSGLVPWLECVFAGVPKMLTGKKFPMNVRALRFVWIFVDDVTSFDEFQEKLYSISLENILAEHSMKNFIRPAFLMILFICAEKEGGFPLHIFACKKNAPIFLCCKT